MGTSSLPFLNTRIEIDGCNFNSSIYKKKTQSGVFMNFTALVPQKWKFGLILCLLHTAKRVCSSERYFNDEVSMLRKMFTWNNYPKTFFDQAFKKFLDKQNSTNLDNSTSSNERSGITFAIPFIGEASYKFSKQVVSLIKSTYDIEILPVFTSTKIGDFFSLKSKTPFPFSSNVVYKFSCLRDADRSYIGQTKRHFMTRVNEHVALSSSKSEIKSHIRNCPICFNKKFNVDNFQLLKKCRNSFNTRISEALFIRKFLPKFNKQLRTKGMFYFLKVFWK